jgi:hypothetical protein
MSNVYTYQDVMHFFHVPLLSVADRDIVFVVAKGSLTIVKTRFQSCQRLTFLLELKTTITKTAHV